MTEKELLDLLTNLETLAQSATPQPWKFDSHNTGASFYTGYGLLPCDCGIHIEMRESDDEGKPAQAAANAAYIAAACNAAPGLCAEVRKLQERVKELEHTLDQADVC